MHVVRSKGVIAEIGKYLLLVMKKLEYMTIRASK